MARDLIHEAVKAALINDGWIVTDDPFPLEIQENGRKLKVDLGAEKLFAAQRETDKILVEIKSFASPSILNKFHEALGQYLDYREAMIEGEIDRKLYLAISDYTYEKILDINFLLRRISQFDLKIIIVDLENKMIVKWIE